MLLAIVLLLSVVTTTITFAIPGDNATVAELFALSTQGQPIEPWHNQPTHNNGPTDHQSHALQERYHRINQYSYVVSKDHLVTWVFGNTTRNFNISIASCVKMGDVAGVYHFANGSMSYDATVRDIITDLEIGTSRGTRATYAAQTLKNAVSAYDEVQAFLSEDILVAGSSLVHNKERRAINFQSEGRILGLVIKTLYGLGLGMAAVQIAAAISDIQITNGQLIAGAIVGAGSVSVYTIIDIVTDEGGLTGLEPKWMESTATYVVNVFMAQLRKMVMLARGTPGSSTRPHYTENELAAALTRLDAYSAWDTETTPMSTGTFDIEGICDQESQDHLYHIPVSAKVQIAKPAGMKMQTCFMFLASNVLIIAKVHASPDLSLPINNTPEYSALAAGQSAACFPAAILGSHLADTRSCLQAAISLPDGADAGTFHNGGVEDGYKLPKVKVYGPCMATVSIRAGNTDRSSWDHISWVASQIAAICSNGQYPRGTTGGVKYAGFGGNIRVTLEKAPGVGSSDSGSTNSTATS